MIKYFAYGSNLASERMQSRVPSAEVSCQASLEGYSFRFHKISKDGSAKANAFQTGMKSDVVLGVVWDIANEDDLPALDRAEGAGYGYHREDVRVRTPDGELEAFTYVADREAIDDSLLPYDWYKELVIVGALTHGLPNDYIEGIRAFPSIVDEDDERRQKNSIF